VTPVDPKANNNTDILVTMEMMKLALNSVQHQVQAYEKQLEKSNYRYGSPMDGNLDILKLVSRRDRFDASYLLPIHDLSIESMMSPMTCRNLTSNVISPECMNASITTAVAPFPERSSMVCDSHYRSTNQPVVETSTIHQGNGIVDNDDDDDGGSMRQRSCTSSMATTESPEVMHHDCSHGETCHGTESRTIRKKRNWPDDGEFEPTNKRQKSCGDATITLE
jgi:hypothetical protein